MDTKSLDKVLNEVRGVRKDIVALGDDVDDLKRRVATRSDVYKAEITSGVVGWARDKFFNKDNRRSSIESRAEDQNTSSTGKQEEPWDADNPSLFDVRTWKQIKNEFNSLEIIKATKWSVSKAKSALDKAMNGIADKFDMSDDISGIGQEEIKVVDRTVKKEEDPVVRIEQNITRLVELTSMLVEASQQNQKLVGYTNVDTNDQQGRVVNRMTSVTPPAPVTEPLSTSTNRSITDSSNTINVDNARFKDITTDEEQAENDRNDATLANSISSIDTTTKTILSCNEQANNYLKNIPTKEDMEEIVDSNSMFASVISAAGLAFDGAAKIIGGLGNALGGIARNLPMLVASLGRMGPLLLGAGVVATVAMIAKAAYGGFFEKAPEIKDKQQFDQQKEIFKAEVDAIMAKGGPENVSQADMNVVVDRKQKLVDYINNAEKNGASKAEIAELKKELDRIEAIWTPWKNKAIEAAKKASDSINTNDTEPTEVSTTAHNDATAPQNLTESEIARLSELITQKSLSNAEQQELATLRKKQQDYRDYFNKVAKPQRTADVQAPVIKQSEVQTLSDQDKVIVAESVKPGTSLNVEPVAPDSARQQQMLAVSKGGDTITNNYITNNTATGGPGIPITATNQKRAPFGSKIIQGFGFYDN